LGPVGVGALAALALARAMPAAVPGAAGAVATPSLLFASALWGFGVWWLAVAVALLVRYLRAGGFAFHLGWWAFTFPLGALTVATLGIARAWQAPALDAVGAVLYVGLVVVWAVVGTRTVRGVLSGRIWQR
ncbi:MAG: C4-dicarboxylate ABC transporter, partial [Cellulomonas sp.]|nr:C4-dicarboxylate ABC transporter [Cellulomonas sp.]